MSIFETLGDISAYLIIVGLLLAIIQELIELLKLTYKRLKYDKINTMDKN